MPTVYGHEDFSARAPGDFDLSNTPLIPVSLEDRCNVRAESWPTFPQITGGKLVVPLKSLAPSVFVRFGFDLFDLPGNTEFDLIILGTGDFVVSTTLYGPGGIFTSPVFGESNIPCSTVLRISFAVDGSGNGAATSVTNPALDRLFTVSADPTPYFETSLVNIEEGTIEAVYFVSPDFQFGDPIPTNFWTNLLKSEEL